MSRVLPILFNTDMVRAILDGRKTVTRRCIKPQPTYSKHDGFSWKGYAYGTDLPPTIKGAAYNFRCAAPFQSRDILYVREMWTTKCSNCEFECNMPCNAPYYIYRADVDAQGDMLKWRPSIHMPKEAARIWLKVTDVRIERLQEITEEDAKAEGANWKNGKNVGWEEKMKRTARDRFAEIWNSIIKKCDLDIYGWDANPWVWVISFERCEKPEEV